MSSSTRNRKVLENLNNASEERTDVLEKQLTEAKLIAEEADKKYDEVKLRGLEARATSHPCFLCRKRLKVEVKKNLWNFWSPHMKQGLVSPFDLVLQMVSSEPELCIPQGMCLDMPKMCFVFFPLKVNNSLASVMEWCVGGHCVCCKPLESDRSQVLYSIAWYAK